MDYIELDVKVSPRQPGSDLLITELAEAGFESFSESEEGFCAYIPAADFPAELPVALVNPAPGVGTVRFSRKLIGAKNWNEVWEAQFEPVLVGGKCLIRAPFHAKGENAETEIVLQPNQSFGTGHHPTTRLMLEKLLTLPLAGRSVIDMGCGTGILGIYAAKCGASPVYAFDIDPAVTANAEENADRNAAGITVHTGDERNLSGIKTEIFLANINRNVLLAALPFYAAALEEDGDLLLSGFFYGDIPLLSETAESSGLVFAENRLIDEWALLHFRKKTKNI